MQNAKILNLTTPSNKSVAKIFMMGLVFAFFFFAKSCQQADSNTTESDLKKFSEKQNKDQISKRSPLCADLSRNKSDLKDLIVDFKWGLNPTKWYDKDDRQRHQKYKEQYEQYAKSTAIELQLYAVAKMLNVPHDQSALTVLESWFKAFAPKCGEALSFCKIYGCHGDSPEFPIAWAAGVFDENWKTQKQIFESPSLTEVVKQCGPTQQTELSQKNLENLFKKLNRTCSLTKSSKQNDLDILLHDSAVKALTVDRYINVAGNKEMLKGMCLLEEHIIDRKEAIARKDTYFTVLQTVAQVGISATLAFLQTPEVATTAGTAIPILLTDELIMLSAILTPSIMDLTDAIHQRNQMKFISNCANKVLNDRIGRRIDLITTDTLGAIISATVGIGIFNGTAMFAKMIREGTIKFVKNSGHRAVIKNGTIVKSIKTLVAPVANRINKNSIKFIMEDGKEKVLVLLPSPNSLSKIVDKVFSIVPHHKTMKNGTQSLANLVENRYQMLFNIEPGKVPSWLTKNKSKILGDHESRWTEEQIAQIAHKNFFEKTAIAYHDIIYNAHSVLPKRVSQGKALLNKIQTGVMSPKDAVEHIFMDSGILGETVGPSISLAGMLFSRVYKKVTSIKPNYEEIATDYDAKIQGSLKNLSDFKMMIQEEIEQKNLLPVFE